MLYTGTSHVIITKKNGGRGQHRVQIAMCNCSTCFGFVYWFCFWVQSKYFFCLFVFQILKSQIRLMGNYRKPSWWNMLQLQNAVCFTGLIILVTFLVKLLTDTARKPKFCRKTRSDTIKAWPNGQDTVFYCIWCLFRHVWHVCFHISSLIAAVLWWAITPSISSLFLFFFSPKWKKFWQYKSSPPIHLN